jgi:periplasmic divalent cation tolerance protein
MTTVPDNALAESMARALVEQKAAACVQILGPIRSHYLWQGKQENSEEYLLLCKTPVSRRAALQQAIRKLHPYEVPEILFYEGNGGWPPYLQWMHA